jgi:hypothetical protein
MTGSAVRRKRAAAVRMKRAAGADRATGRLQRRRRVIAPATNDAPEDQQ